MLFTGVVFKTMSNATEQNNSFEGLRNLVFNLNPEEIGLTKDNFDHVVWGLVMETGFDTGSFSLVALADGTTSLYLSTGGGTIGAGEHETVRNAVGHYLTGAQHFISKAQTVHKYPLPSNGNVIFYFLTFDGISAYSAAEEKLGNGDDELSDLFYAAHAVITEIREIEEK
jgi:hypothetical protein